MSISFGNKNVKEMYFGNKKVAKVYFGNKLVWPKAIVDAWKYLVAEGAQQATIRPAAKVKFNEPVKLLGFSFYTIYNPPAQQSGLGISISRCDGDFDTAVNSRGMKMIASTASLSYSTPQKTDYATDDNKPIYRIDVTPNDTTNGIQLLPGSYLFRLPHSKENQYEANGNDLVFKDNDDYDGYFTTFAYENTAEGSYYSTWDDTSWIKKSGNARLDIKTKSAFDDDPILTADISLVQEFETVKFIATTEFAGTVIDLAPFITEYNFDLGGTEITTTNQIVPIENLRFTARPFTLPAKATAVSREGNVTPEITIDMSIDVNLNFTQDELNDKMVWTAMWGDVDYADQIESYTCVFRNGPSPKTEVVTKTEVTTADLENGTYQLVCTLKTKNGNVPVSKYKDNVVINHDNDTYAGETTSNATWLLFTPTVNCKLTSYTFYTLNHATSFASGINLIAEVIDSTHRTILETGSFSLGSSVQHTKKTTDGKTIWKTTYNYTKTTPLTLTAGHTYMLPISYDEWNNHSHAWTTNTAEDVIPTCVMQAGAIEHTWQGDGKTTNGTKAIISFTEV